MEKVRYVLHPGLVKSKTDGQVHYISAGELIHLYQVKSEDCVVWPPREAERRVFQGRENDVHLYPKYDGDYSIGEEHGLGKSS